MTLLVLASLLLVKYLSTGRDLHNATSFLLLVSRFSPCVIVAYSYEGEERCVQCFGGETCWKEAIVILSRRVGDNIKVDLKEIGSEGWTGFLWLRIGTGGRPL
jgi:hypothetical protein